MKKDKLIIVGGGGHGRVLLDIAKLTGYSAVKFLDDHLTGSEVLGKVCDFAKYIGEYDFIVGIGDNRARQKVSEYLRAEGVKLTSLIHPGAIMSENVVIGEGVTVMAGAVVNSGAVLSDGVIVNTCASVDHDNILRAYAHVSVGAHLCGTVTVGSRSLIGAGSIIINNVEIAENVIIGAGGVVVKTIESPGVYAGVPVKRIGD